MAQRVKILFVDDDLAEAGVGSYLDELRRHFQVVTVDDPAGAKGALALHRDVRVIVLDMQMKVPQGVLPKLVDNGATTGLWVMRENRRRLQHDHVGVVVLSNRDPDHWIAPLIEEARPSYPPLDQCRMLGKVRTRAVDLATIVERLCGELDQRYGPPPSNQREVDDS